ncbi:MAG: GDP-mannose 4,6-dehydratase [Sphingomonas sp.]|uniref:GDP-mannose 4,6-dehydratase n=1 Tax=Sphingomonas sp. TaxID=28214 RepID=UPI001ACC478F|nr:GDP-mannose 4,6-dehydratase [Sphingomonas sp.]MBN8816731.1 GDP-mannose 4,6-dehydratase [Sphingomonas sp.]
MVQNEIRTALITGITGQDASYLAEYLVGRGVTVVGTTRDVAGAASQMPPALAEQVTIVEWDLIDKERFVALLTDHRPTEIYNFAAFSSGQYMDRDPERVVDINGVAVVRMLEAIRSIDPSIRFCQASSSEVFAGSGISPQSENTPFVPRSVYGAAKILADNAVKLYREKYGVFCCSAYLFNHESPRRGDGFVTTKIVRAAVAIKSGRQTTLALGNLAAARDWGFAGDYVRAMALMLEAERPSDYVVASGATHTVAEFCDRAFGAVGLDYRDHVVVDPAFFRPVEAMQIVGDPTRAHADLGWAPTTTFPALVDMMIAAELGDADRG